MAEETCKWTEYMNDCARHKTQCGKIWASKISCPIEHYYYKMTFCPFCGKRIKEARA